MAVGGSFADDLAWFEENRLRLARVYQGKYVAVVGKTVVDSDPDFSALARRVFARYGPRSVVIQKAAPARVVEL